MSIKEKIQIGFLSNIFTSLLVAYAITVAGLAYINQERGVVVIAFVVWGSSVLLAFLVTFIYSFFKKPDNLFSEDYKKHELDSELRKSELQLITEEKKISKLTVISKEVSNE